MAKQFKRKLDVIKSKYDKRDFLAENIYPVQYNLPSSLDYRDKLNSIRDQGSQGACAGFAGACMKEVHEHFDVNLSEYLSPQFIYNNREDKDLEGMYMRDLMKILTDVGVCKESTYKYGTSKKITDKILKEAKNYIVQSYASINTIDACKRSLVQNGPCVLAVPVYHYLDNIWKPVHVSDEVLGGHAMTIIGYSDNDQHFIVRNSWGKSWGDNGYTYFPYSDWGLQWEIWTTVDEKSDVIPDVEPENKGCNFLANLFNR